MFSLNGIKEQKMIVIVDGKRGMGVCARIIVGLQAEELPLGGGAASERIFSICNEI